VSTYRLDKLFQPELLALVGASVRGNSLGRAVLLNLRRTGFAGPIHLVNPKYSEIDGTPCVPSISALASVPDLVIITSPPETVPGLIAEAGRVGVSAAVIITAGLGHGEGSLHEEARLAARQYGLRLVGPNCLGILSPAASLNASFAASAAMAGDLALISQSGAVAAGMIEWAAEHRVGFSAVVSLGDQCDVDFGDCLDYFAADPATRAILLYVESVRDARKFMSAARAAARLKPVIVVKSGRFSQGAKAAATHTGALAGSDAVYDAAFRRAGLIRVFDLDELFSAAETLGRQGPFEGDRLAILTNGGGVGVLAVDCLIANGGTLAGISNETMAKLDTKLPAAWSRANPIDIIGDADAARFTTALDALLRDSSNDAVLVIQVQTAMTGAVAEAVARTVAAYRAEEGGGKPVFALWVGNETAAAHVFDRAAIPHFGNEADAIRGFMHLVHYRRAQDSLAETPDSLPESFRPDVAAARRIVAAVLADKRTWLTPVEANALLTAYDIPVEPVFPVGSASEAADVARGMLAKGQAVAVKIWSPDIIHKSDVSGVALDLGSENAVRDAAQQILDRAARLRPDARVSGVIVQAMARRANARELIAGLTDDPTFGPVVVFGLGGVAVEIVRDQAIALPPLDLKFARDLIGLTRVSRTLKGFRNVPAADEHAIQATLVKLSELAADIPEIRSLDLNPLLADADGVLSVDARVAIAAAETGRGTINPRFAMRPYPREWEREVVTQLGRRYFVRPVRPDDEKTVLDFIGRVSTEDLRLRFFGVGREFTHAFIARLVQLDYARSIAFVAFDPTTNEMAGVVRLHADADHVTGEYAVLIRSDLKGRGLGWKLMEVMIEWARADAITTISGQVLRENAGMIAMCRQLGFSVVPNPDDPALLDVTLSPLQGKLTDPVGAHGPVAREA